MAAAPKPPTFSATHRCPACGAAALRRVPRLPEDRQQGVPPEMRRYECRSFACDWSGLLKGGGSAGSHRRRSDATRRRIWLVLAIVALLLAAMVAALAAQAWSSAVAPVRAKRLAAGESYDGMPLTVSHPLLKRVSLREGDGRGPSAPPASAPFVRTRAALHVRQFCAWGDPGRDPYRGTPEQVLGLAQLPPEVVSRISDDIRARRRTDQLTISNAGIHADDSGRSFDAQQIAMSFGETLCLETRVNFKTDHAERADLYEARAANGRVYAVMVPRVCGNVSVLGQRGERARRRLDGALPASDANDEPRMLPEELITAEDDGQAHRLAAGRGLEVPEPGSLLLATLALAALALLGALRARH